ncbi:MAG: hypothetical protein CVU56_27215 [Deltaproteobacteria bacterium HGW-Deltaproteobacteria-14]|nr:MAG: hypothetical protein CVU56_27215 [Deltaproteobacteria bacterium HGW-Deltaproteobacteria-14]
MKTPLMRFCALALALGLMPVTALAAGPPAEVSQVGTSDATVKARLGPLLEALRAAEDPDAKRIVRVAWWGDSAVVSDGYTGKLRERLQARFGDAGPGFMLLDTTFDGYLHDGVRMKRHGWSSSNVIQGNLKSGLYGYGGIQSESFGGAATTYEADAPLTSVSVFYRAFPKAGDLQLFADDAPNATATESTAGATPGDRVWRWEAPPGGVKTVKIRAGGGGQTVAYGVALERGDNGVTIDALGLLGMRARRWLNADADHVKAQLEARHPELLVLNFGGNERVDPGLTADRHKDDIVATLRHLRAGAPEAACLVVGPIAHGVRVKGKVVLDPDLKTVYAGQRAAAEEVGCAFFDTVAAMGGDDAVELFRKQKRIGGDLSHLNGAGHRAVGDLLADWFIATYDAWKTETAAAQ